MEEFKIEHNIVIFKYKPSLFRPFYINMEPLTFMMRIRFLLDWYYGYYVYYLCIDNEFIGYCAITSGRNPRYWFAERGDIIIGPYFICESCRGKGYSTLMVDMVINKIQTSWNNAYLYILNTNLASIGVVKHLEGTLLFHVRNTFFRKLIKCENGEYGVYKILKKNFKKY